MRIGNQAVIQELAERIDQADAVVIGGGSGLSSAAGYDHSPLVPGTFGGIGPLSRTVWLYLSAGWIPVAFPAMGSSGGYYSQYMRFMWETPTGQPYLDLQALVADKPAFCSDH